MTSRSLEISAGANREFRSMSARTSSKSSKRSGGGARVEAGELFAGEGVQIAADAFDGLGDIGGRPLLRAFEEQVLDEMAGAIERRRLITRAYADPYPDADAGHVRHFGGRDGESVGQVCEGIHAAFAFAQANARGTTSGGPTRRL